MPSFEPPDPTNPGRSTPNISADDAVLHLGSSIFIDAPVHEVWRVLTDTSTWPYWNTFCPRVTIRQQPGVNQGTPMLQEDTRMTFHIHMKPGVTKSERTVPLMVTSLIPPDPVSDRAGRIAWAGDTQAKGACPAGFLLAQRVHQLREVDVDALGGGTKRVTEVRNWEIQIGYLAFLVKWMYGSRLKANFETWVLDLKRFVEKQTNDGWI